jgi:hypothetical protein
MLCQRRLIAVEAEQEHAGGEHEVGEPQRSQTGIERLAGFQLAG